MEKLTNNYTLHLDDATRDLVEKLASFYNRKPCELLRLLLVPQLSKEWAIVQTKEHEENNEKMTLAKFHL